MAIIRVPSGNASSLAIPHLGFTTIHADTLVYYDCDIESVVPRERTNSDIEFRNATLSDIDELSILTRYIFHDYRSHYSANRLFDPSGIPHGYGEWAASFVGQESKQVLLACAANEIVGFLTFEVEDETAEIVLNGVHPEWAGRGIYGDLITLVQEYAAQFHFQRIVVSTQVHNISVQRAWRREGFKLSHAYDTFHINTLFSAGARIAEYRLDLSHEVQADHSAAVMDVVVRAGRDIGLRASNVTWIPLRKIVGGAYFLSIRSVDRRDEPTNSLIVGELRQVDGTLAAVLQAKKHFLLP
ncbi:GNAT family N-acetyltransferase [Leifsonia sp. A12D58]|uniref:GNAT family N-acetyltransferase n=1 Tax=Leifsonia sp. A12D58 TaxID=3397674 RepID=UPI0039DF79E9